MQETSFWELVKNSPEWLLAVVAVLTLLVILYQAIEMRRATEVMRSSTDAVQRQTTILDRSTAATEKSVRLQEVAMRQWVSIERWHGQIITRQGETILEFGFDIVNRTKFPLKLEYITTNANGCASQRNADQLLAPEKEYSVKGATGRLSGEQHLKYSEAKLTIFITGAVTYKDVFEKRRTQLFNTMCFCSTHSEFVFYPYVGTQGSGPEEDNKET